MIRNINRNHTKLSDLVAALVNDIGTHHAGSRQVRDNVFAIAVYNTVIVNAIGAMNNNLVTGIIGHSVRGREQSIQVTNNTGNTSDAYIRLIVQLQNRQRTFGHIRTKVPAVVLAAGIHTVCSHACVIKHRLIVACELDLINVCVPVTGEVLDGLPAFRQSQVISQLIAAIQRIPESTAILQSRQDLLCVDRGNTNHEMNVFLAILLCCTNFALFALRDVHDSVGEQRSFGLGRFVVRQVTNLVHQEVASTRQVKVACAEPGLTSLFIGNCFGCRVRIVTELSTSHVTASVFNPDRAESNLRVGVSLGSFECGSSRHIIWEVGRITILDSALSLRIGVRLQFHTQLVRTVHNTSLTVGAVRTTSGQNHRNSIGRKDCTRIDVAAVSTHQSIHVPVAVINVGDTVQNIITGRGIVLIGTVSTTLIVITRTGVSIASFMSVVPGTGIGIHRVMADAHAIALTQKRFDCVIGFTRKVRLLIDADTPADRVNSIITLGIHHITVRVLVKSFNLNRKDRNMLTHVATIIILQPTVISYIVDKVCIHTSCIRNPGIQENNSILVLCAGCTSAIATIITEYSCVRRNTNCSTSQIPIVTVIVRTKIDGLAIPLRVNFKLISVS